MSVEPTFLFECPHCHVFIEVLIRDMNCRIFRHGVFKDTWQQIPPHSSKETIDGWLRSNLIFGCGKPFKLSVDGQPVICEYI
jgi:hypothetical protein